MFMFAIFIFSILFNFLCAIHRPSYINACHRNDPNLNKCAEISAKITLNALNDGDPTFKIPSLKPLHINNLDLPPVRNIKLSLSNVTVRGLDMVDTGNFKFNLTSQDLYFEALTPLLEITGDYVMSGRLLIFPLEGKGKVNITYIDGTYYFPTHYELITKKGIQYINITEHKVTFTAKRAYFYFGNLFNGNKLLGDQVLKFMDENWNEVNKDFGPLLAQAFDSVATNTANAIFNKVPYDEIFLP